MSEPLFLRACRSQPTERTPAWYMRQAGRYMAEYRAIRAKVGFMELCHTPELCCEVTLQPVDRLGVDAAILFCDLLVPLEAMGCGVHFPKGGPVIEGGVARPEDVDRLLAPPAAEALGYVGDAVELICRALPPEIPLIGFAGAPFTLASYLIEGGSSRSFLTTKRFLYEQPQAATRLFEKLSAMVIDFLRHQIDKGCRVVQVFDSWAGCLDPHDYEVWGLGYTRRIVEGVRAHAPEVPVIVFAKGTGPYFEKVAACGADVLGVDWTLPIDRARRMVGEGVALQGNLDPARLLGPYDALVAAADRVLDEAGDGRGHIFNLGHGITPTTPVEHVVRLTDHLREASAARRSR